MECLFCLVGVVVFGRIRIGFFDLFVESLLTPKIALTIVDPRDWISSVGKRVGIRFRLSVV